MFRLISGVFYVSVSVGAKAIPAQEQDPVCSWGGCGEKDEENKTLEKYSNNRNVDPREPL